MGFIYDLKEKAQIPPKGVNWSSEFQEEAGEIETIDLRLN